jgi:hypothetical protein
MLLGKTDQLALRLCLLESLSYTQASATGETVETFGSARLVLVRISLMTLGTELEVIPIYGVENTTILLSLNSI